MKNVVFCFCIIALMTSCKPTQTIVYKTDKVKALEVGNNVNLSFSVQTFEDIRSESEMNQTHFAAKHWSKRIDGKESCINSEVLYKVPVAEQMTAIFAQHLHKKMPQIVVSTNQKEISNYYLQAKVKHFYGIQGFSTAAAIGSQFGLIGALATANVKTDGKIIIELTDIKIFDKQNNLVASIGDFRKEYEGEFPANASCLCIYQNVNQKLSEFNDELIELLSLEVQNHYYTDKEGPQKSCLFFETAFIEIFQFSSKISDLKNSLLYKYPNLLYEEFYPLM